MATFRRTPILVVLLLSLLLVATGCGSGSSSPNITQAPTATTIPTPANTPLPSATSAPKVPLTCTAPSTLGFTAGTYFPIDSQGNFVDTSGTLWGPLTLNADGSLNRAGEKGCYALSQQQITFTDDFTGHFPCPQTAQTGVYTWAFDGKILSFTLVNDDCHNRADFFTKYRWETHP